MGGPPLWGAQEADVLLHAGFEGTVAAKTAKGPLPPNRTSGDVQFEEGVRGKALVAGEAGALLHYATKGNVEANRGTVEMWVKPVDWTPAEEGFHIFFMSSSKDGWVQLYKFFPSNSGLLMLAGKGGRPNVDYWYASGASSAILKKGEWVHLAGTWDSGRIVLYANGERVGALQGNVAPAALGETFVVGDNPWSKSRRASKTLIDELRIYSRPLAPSEVRRVYRSYVAEEGGDPGPHRMAVVKTSRPPAIDGVLADIEWSEPEWSRAPAVTGFIDIRNQKFATRQARAHFTYDDERLYFAMASDIEPGTQPVANITQRDGAVWGDDAIEFFIAPPGQGEKEKPLYFQLVGNSAGVFLDGKSGDKTWNGAWNYRARVFGAHWAAEGSIRWRDLGIDPPKDGDVWRVNFARDRQEPQAWTVWGHTAGFHDVSKFAYMLFRDSGTVAQVESLGAFTGGNVAFDANLASIGAAEGDDVVGRLMAGSSETVAEATVPPGGKAKLEFRTRITDRSADALALRIVSKTFGDVLWEGRFPFEWTEAIIAELSPVPSADVIEAKVNIAGMASIPRSAAAKITFTERSTSRKVAEFLCERFDEKNRSLTEIPLERVPVGSYDVAVRILDGDAVVGETKIPFDRRDEPWKGNTIGITEAILPGWTPIEVAGKTLKCWGRDVSFDGTLFPSEIVTRGASILASPIRLAAKRDGKPVEWKDIAFEITKQTPARVDFVTSATTDDIRVENVAYLEYDGMFFFKMKLIPIGRKATLDNLSLVIPLMDERAIFWHFPKYPDYGGRVAQGDGVVWKRAFKEYMWIGDYDRGLTWFAEDCTQWSISDARSVLELVRTEEAVQWRVHFADALMEIEAPMTIAFGLHPTPVKPLPKGWRLWSMAAELGQSLAWIAAGPHTTTMTAGYPEAPDPAYIRRRTDDLHRRGVRVVLPYMHPVRIAELSPEWQFYGRDWAMPGIVDGGSGEYHGYPRGADMGVCPSVRELRDWYAWKNEKYLDSTGYDGLYYDHAWPYHCGHANHDHAPGAMPLLGYREHFRRLYTLCKERDPNNLVAAHISGGLFSPMLSWTDITVAGEELVSPMLKAREREETKNTNDLFDVIDLDYYHAWCTGRQFGQAPVYLAPVWSYPQHHNVYMLLTDSIGAWRTDPSLLQLYDDLGMDEDDVEFLPFWNNGDVVQASYTTREGLESEKRPTPLVSAYRRPGRFVMFAVCNMTKAKRKATVRFDSKALGFEPAQCALADAYPRHPLFAPKEVFDVEIEGHSYRLILLKKIDEGDTTRSDVSLMTPSEEPASYATGYARQVTGTGRLRGDGEELLFVGDAVRDEKAPLPQESRVAQTFTLTRPTKIQSINMESREPKVERSGLLCDLRIYTVNADGTPSDELAHPKAWAGMASRPGEPNFYAFFFRESFVLPAGRYVLVLTKPAALPEERHHFAFARHDKKRLPEETALVWENDAPGWREVGGVLSFAVFGYER